LQDFIVKSIVILQEVQRKIMIEERSYAQAHKNPFTADDKKDFPSLEIILMFDTL